MTYNKDNTTVSVDRVSRAMATLKSTGQRTEVPWLRSLCQRKWWEAASIEKLASCGYRVRYDRTDPRRVW